VIVACSEEGGNQLEKELPIIQKVDVVQDKVYLHIDSLSKLHHHDKKYRHIRMNSSKNRQFNAQFFKKSAFVSHLAFLSRMEFWVQDESGPEQIKAPPLQKKCAAEKSHTRCIRR